MTHSFQVGDIVRLRTGTEPIRVFKVFEKTLSGRYINTPQYTQLCRRAGDFIPYEESQDMKLYKTKDDQYGTVLAKDSAGRVVLEMKGSNKVEAFDPNDLTEVVPYTVEIKGHGPIEIAEGKLKVGDLVTSDTVYGRVLRVDTKCRTPTPAPDNMRRLVTEEI